MKAIIMAGGFGSRLRPLTCDMPKPMVPLLNKPVMEYSVELLKDHGIEDIGITTCYLPEMIEEYFEDGSHWGVNFQYFLEEEPLGTAGSVGNARDFLDETFVVVSGDALTDVDLTQAIEYHKAKGGLATLVLSRQQVPLEYGVVIIDQNGEITRFLEKPSWGEVFSDLVNTGIYILEPEVFDYFEKGTNLDFSKDLFPLLMQDDQPLYGYPSECYWSDIGDLESYMQTHFDVLTGQADVYIRGQQIDEGIWVNEGVTIPENVHLSAPVYLGEEVYLKPGTHLEATVVGNHSTIETGSSLKRSILWSGVYLGRNSEVRAGFICDGARVNESCRIFEGAALGKDTTVGRNVTIQPGVKIWPGKEVEDFTNLNKSLVWAPKWKKRLFNKYGVHGLSNIEMTPEFVSKLAAAYGSTFENGAEVTLSHDNYPTSKMLHSAVISGLLSSGIKVNDLGEMPSPIARYNIALMNSQGGMHIRCCYDNPEETIIEFIDENGINIDKGGERGIEKKFFTEGLKRANQAQVGNYFYLPEMVNNYVEGLQSLINMDQIIRRQFKLVLDYEHDNLAMVLPPILDSLNCAYDSTYNYGGEGRPLSYPERVTTSNRVGAMMLDLDADIGVIMDHNGENLALIAENGRVVSDEEFEVIMAMVLLHHGVRRVVIPISAPQYIDELVAEYGGEVVRTRSDRQTVMRTFYREAVVDGMPFFFPYSDGVAALVLLMDFMVNQNISLGQLLESIPSFYTTRAQIECPWGDKGKVMRQLIEHTNGQDVDLVDGVKVNHDQGSTWIYPDQDEPVFHVYTEANDPAIASEVNQSYASMVEDIQLS